MGALGRALVVVLLGGPQVTPSDPDLIRGVAQVREGDFEAALVSLAVATQRLGAEPRRSGELTLALLYQGVAYLELNEEALAREKFRLALERNRQMRLDPHDFSAQQIRLFEAVRREIEASGGQAARPGPPGKTKKGSGTTVLVVGAGAAVAGVVVAAAGGGGPGSTTPSSTPSTSPPATSPPSTLPPSACSSPPTATWVTPANRAVVSGTVTLMCSIPAGLDCPSMFMEFRRCDGDCTTTNQPRFIGIGNAFNPPNYSVAWDTTLAPNGLQTLVCIFHVATSAQGPARFVEVRN